MAIQYLKFRDTRPVIEVFLKNPDGSAYDLTGADSVTLHVHLNDGTIVSRAMTVEGVATLGCVRYVPVAADWDTANLAGFLIAGPELPLARGEREHLMEYEVVDGTARLTFPNGGETVADRFDTLRVSPDIGQAA